MSNAEQPIIVKKIKKGGHGHHGGAWKVAYADFVTAMMAFFLLMWLLNTTTPEQKKGIADYFAPASISSSQSGAGGILGGTVFADDGSRRGGASGVIVQSAPPQSTRATTDADDGTDTGAPGQNDGQPSAKDDLSQSALGAALAMRESSEFERAEVSIRQALQAMPELTELSKQLIIEQTPEGMRIQLVDQEGRSMFPPDGIEPYDHTKKLLRRVAQMIEGLPNRLAISGHTDATPYYGPKGISNWEMSSGRANSARRVLQEAGIPDDRVAEVTGKAATEPLFPDDPFQAANRRIAILLLREAPPLPPGHRL